VVYVAFKPTCTLKKTVLLITLSVGVTHYQCLLLIGVEMADWSCYCMVTYSHCSIVVRLHVCCHFLCVWSIHFLLQWDYSLSHFLLRVLAGVCGTSYELLKNYAHVRYNICLLQQ